MPGIKQHQDYSFFLIILNQHFVILVYLTFQSSLAGNHFMPVHFISTVWQKHVEVGSSYSYIYHGKKALEHQLTTLT